MHTELVSVSATAPGSTGAAASAFTVSGGPSDSLTVKNSAKWPRIIAAWAANQSDGTHGIKAQSMHDQIDGLKVVVNGSGASQPFIGSILPEIGLSIPLRPQETITYTIAGSATAGDVETGHFLVFYEDLPGVQARAMNTADLAEYAEEGKMLTVQATITGTATGYTGAVTLDSLTSKLIAQQDYAILGATVDKACGAITFSGSDFGNARIGMPGNDIRPDLMAGYFARLSAMTGLPVIPVVNAGNLKSTYIGLAQNENFGAVSVSLFLQLLKPWKEGGR